ncbi:hypothetical protein TRIUR3_00060 [Triticum urartu]|uniref:Uncharacterized protein n=1 Tax=Triticum urartu TaxID=4572 RepID=M7YIJ1_TRIUA|nr:hypothetical protein TRIUR3_00060 [Triticum urartu]
MERQRRAFEEIKARHRRREEGGVVVLDSDHKDVPGPSTPPHISGTVWVKLSRVLADFMFQKRASRADLRAVAGNRSVPRRDYHSDRGKEAAAELVRVFVSTAVAAYLDRTAAVRTSDQVLAGVSNPKHDAKLKDLLVSVCNGAVETFVRTSRQVTKEASISRAEAAVAAREVCNSGPSCVMERVSTTLAMPSNRRFVLDVTGRVTAEMVRSFLEFSTQRVSAGARKSIVIARDEITERGLVAVKYLSAKSMAIFTLCLTMCMHISVGMRFPLPA